MAYATVGETSHHGAAVYGAGNFEIRKAEGGFIYFPTPAKAAAIHAMGNGPVAMDSAGEKHAVGNAAWLAKASEAEIAALVKRRCKPVAADKDVDRETERVARRLLPKALAIKKAEDEAMAADDKDSENHDLFNAGPEAEDGEEMPIENRAANWYLKARDYWKRVSTRTRQGSQLQAMTGRYSSPTAVKTKAAVAADSQRAEDPVAANARKAKQFSMYSRF